MQAPLKRRPDAFMTFPNNEEEQMLLCCMMIVILHTSKNKIVGSIKDNSKQVRSLITHKSEFVKRKILER